MAEGFAERVRRMLTGGNRPAGKEAPAAVGAPDGPDDDRGAGTTGIDHGAGRRGHHGTDDDTGDGARAGAPDAGHPQGGRWGVPAPPGMRSYPGDYPGVPAMHYAPEPDGLPDPGEVVWTWVPFEEDPGLGKDRPVLLVGLDGDWLLGVMLTSRDHDAAREREHRAGREWVDVGTGAWDPRGRPSEARTDRIVRVDPDAIRREGAVLDRERFDAVARAVRASA